MQQNLLLTIPYPLDALFMHLRKNSWDRKKTWKFYPEQVDIAAIRNLVKENANVLQQEEPEVSLNSVNSKSAELRVLLWINDFNKEATTTSEVKSALYTYLESKGIAVNWYIIYIL